MTKKIAVIHDLSGFGRCSLTAAIPVISAMGVQACPLPTSVLSAQTGYPSYYCDDYTEKMEYFRAEWEKMKVRFDGIYTGFVAKEAQIGQIFRFLDTFYKEETFLVVDPIMGDEGRRFPFCSDILLERMKELVGYADIVTPNLTELCLLTDSDSEEVIRKTGESREDLSFAEIEDLAGMLLNKEEKTVIVTGIRFFDEADGIRKIGNLTVTKKEARLCAFPYIGGSFSGTGDLFTSVVTGGAAKGADIFKTAELAGEFVKAAMKDAAEEQAERNEGANFEKYLGMLI